MDLEKIHAFCRMGGLFSSRNSICWQSIFLVISLLSQQILGIHDYFHQNSAQGASRLPSRLRSVDDGVGLFFLVGILAISSGFGDSEQHADEGDCE